MERADALERERLFHQLDDYDDWEELKQQEEQQQQQSWGNVYTSPLLTNMKSRVTCPICNAASLWKHHLMVYNLLMPQMQQLMTTKNNVHLL